MAKISVQKQSEETFKVQVEENKSQTTHLVTLPDEVYQRLGNDKSVEKEKLIQCSFEFLLEREPKESILSEFQLDLISKYFPEYDKEIQRRLKNRGQGH